MLTVEQCQAIREKSGNAWRLDRQGLLEWYEADVPVLLETVEELRALLQRLLGALNEAEWPIMLVLETHKALE